MGKIKIEFETKYETGDLVVFAKYDKLLVGIIEGYYLDQSAGISVWYNIRISKDFVFTYSTGGDISEWDIMYIIKSASEEDTEETKALKNYIITGKMND